MTFSTQNRTERLETNQRFFESEIELRDAFASRLFLSSVLNSILPFRTSQAPTLQTASLTYFFDFSHTLQKLNKTPRGDGDAQAGSRERPGTAEPLRSGGSRAAPAGVPRRSEERPGGRVSPLGLRLRHRDASGGRRLPVGGRVRGEGAHLVPRLSGGVLGEVRHGERQRPQNPGEIRHCPAGRGENARKEDGAEEETDQYHRFLPDEEESGEYTAQIRTITRARTHTLRNASVSRLDSCPH